MVKAITLNPISIAKEFATNPFTFISKLIEENGEIFEYKFPGMHGYFIINPTYIEHVFVDNHKNYIKPPKGIELIDDIVGNYSIITTADQHVWHQDRQILIPAFYENKFSYYTEIMGNIVAKRLNDWKVFADEGRVVNVDMLMTELVFENLLRSLFGGIDIDFKLAHSLVKKFVVCAGKEALSGFRILKFLPVPIAFKYKSFKEQVLNLGNEVVEKSLLPQAAENNIIKLLAKGYEQNKDNKDNYLRLRGEALSFIVVGHETISALLIWACMYISLYPNVKDKLQREIKDVLGNRVPTYDDISKLHYTRAIVLETSRLQPGLALLGRQALNDDQIGKLTINKGDLVVISPFHVNRLAQYWPNPEAFDPDRFVGLQEKDYKHHFLSFGLGAHGCIGQHFAMLEATILLAMLFQKYDLWLTSSSSLAREKYSVVNRLNSQVTMRIINAK